MCVPVLSSLVVWCTRTRTGVVLWFSMYSIRAIKDFLAQSTTIVGIMDTSILTVRLILSTLSVYYMIICIRFECDLYILYIPVYNVIY